MKFQRSFAQISLGFFFFAMLYPILTRDMNVLAPKEGNSDIANILWLNRLSEVYLQVFYLGASIIASLLVIRKPPSYSEIEIERFSIEEERIQ